MSAIARQAATGTTVRPGFSLVEDPLAALQSLARAWRRALGARVVGITGSVGKTSVKDIARALLPGAVHANRENLNTEIGLPLTVLEAPAGNRPARARDGDAGRRTDRRAGGDRRARGGGDHERRPGPRRAARLGRGDRGGEGRAPPRPAGRRDRRRPGAGGRARAPPVARRPALLRFGPGGDVEAVERRVVEGVTEALVATPAGRQLFHFPFVEEHNLTNALAAIAAGVALGAPLDQLADGAANIGFSRFRGERLELGDGIVLVNDCYNANPVSMRAALDHLGTLDAGRRIAVLGEMAELGPGASGYHREVGAHARAAGVDLLVGVGEPAREYDPDELVGAPEEAAELLAAQLERGDAILVKGSRSAGLEAVAT